MKKYAVLIAALVAVSAVAAFAATDALVGACIYKFDDTFMTGVRNAMRAEMDKQGGELEIVDSQNRQPTQNDQVDAYISKGANALIVNPVDRTAAEPLMQKAKAEGLPIVFVNREPYADVMAAYDKSGTSAQKLRSPARSQARSSLTTSRQTRRPTRTVTERFSTS